MHNKRIFRDEILKVEVRYIYLLHLHWLTSAPFSGHVLLLLRPGASTLVVIATAVAHLAAEAPHRLRAAVAVIIPLEKMIAVIATMTGVIGIVLAALMVTEKWKMSVTGATTIAGVLLMVTIARVGLDFLVVANRANHRPAVESPVPAHDELDTAE